MGYGINYAENDSEDTGLPPQLFAGDTPAVVTKDVEITVVGTAIKQFTPLMIADPADGFVPWEAGNDVLAVAAYDIPVGTSRAALYMAGMFNIDALNWPPGTLESDAEQGTLYGMVRARKLLHSDQRTGNESEVVGPGNEAGEVHLNMTPDSGTELTAGTQDAVYAGSSATADGGTAPYTYEVVGSLPAGLALNASTGAITGTPTAQGNYNFGIKATDSNGNTGTAYYTLSVAAPI